MTRVERRNFTRWLKTCKRLGRSPSDQIIRKLDKGLARMKRQGVYMYFTARPGRVK